MIGNKSATAIMSYCSDCLDSDFLESLTLCMLIIFAFQVVSKVLIYDLVRLKENRPLTGPMSLKGMGQELGVSHHDFVLGPPIRYMALTQI